MVNCPAVFRSSDHTRRGFLVHAAAASAIASLPGICSAQDARTRLILLGTGGGPRPRKVSAASGQVIVSHGVAYVVDCGDGVPRQLVMVDVSLSSLRHPPVVPAFAYRFDAPDRSIVISGDRAPSENVVRLARGVDVLVHSVMYPAAIDRLVSRGAKRGRTQSQHSCASDVSRAGWPHRSGRWCQDPCAIALRSAGRPTDNRTDVG